MGVIMHNNIPYGGGSSIEPNPQESATEQLETLGIDGDVYAVTDADAIHTSDVGVANGVAELDSNGKVPSSQLPSYVDDVLEYASRSAFPATGETGKIYVALDTNLTYRWGGSDYVEISPSLALGETSSTAYRGDRGKIAYDHSQSDHSGIKPAFTEASTRANIASGDTLSTMLGKIKKWFSDLKTVAFSGSYNDLSDKPTIPTVNDATLTIQKNGTAVETFTANSSTNKTANITVPTKTSDLNNDSGFVTTDEKVTGQTQNPSSSTVYNVPFIGSTNQKPYVNDGLTYATKEGTANSAGWSCLVLGNAVASTSAGSKHGELWLQGDTTNYVKLGVDLGITGNRTINLPDKNGTVALTSDITDEKVTGQVQNPTSGAWYNVPFIGTSNQKPYYNDGFRNYTQDGTTSTAGRSIITLGNNIAYGTNGNKRGELWVYANSGKYVNLKANPNLTGDREIFFPDAGGTVLLGTTYEYNKEIAVSGSSRYLLLGKFPCYDSNVTIEITNTTSTTASAKIVLGTQNINDSHGGVWTFSTYGDENNSITPRVYLLYPQNSRIMEIYFDAGGYSKNTIHIRAVSLNAAPTNIVETVSSIPSGTINPTNVLSYFYVQKGGTIDKTKELVQLYTANSRPTEANLASDNNGGIRKFLSTSAMTSHKPMADGHIIQLDWDNSNYCAAQLYVPNSNPSVNRMQFRTQGSSTTWSNWVTLIDSNSIGSQSVDKATKDGDGNTISSTYAKKASVYKSAVSDSKSSWTAGEGWFADTIGPETKGVYVFIGWAEFDGSLGGRRGIKLARHNSSSTVMASAFTSESADSGYPRTVTCVEYVTCGTDAAVSLAWRRLRLYTANSLSSGTIKGGVIMIKISDL